MAEPMPPQTAAPARKPGRRGERGEARRSLDASIQEVGAIKSIALFGDEARVADHTAQLFFRGLMMRAGRRDHVLLDHDAADVVAAETQSELADLEPGSHPG